MPEPPEPPHACTTGLLPRAFHPFTEEYMSPLEPATATFPAYLPFFPNTLLSCVVHDKQFQSIRVLLLPPDTEQNITCGAEKL